MQEFSTRAGGPRWRVASKTPMPSCRSATTSSPRCAARVGYVVALVFSHPKSRVCAADWMAIFSCSQCPNECPLAAAHSFPFARQWTQGFEWLERAADGQPVMRHVAQYIVSMKDWRWAIFKDESLYSTRWSHDRNACNRYSPSAAHAGGPIYSRMYWRRLLSGSNLARFTSWPTAESYFQTACRICVCKYTLYVKMKNIAGIDIQN